MTTQVLPAIYDVTMTYASHSMTKTSIASTPPTTVPFTTHTLTVKLLTAGGAGLSGGSVTVTPTGDSSFSLGSTNASGIVTATVLDGPYTIAMSYSGMTSTQTADTERGHDGDLPDRHDHAEDVFVDRCGLSGQDSAIWWRPAGHLEWSFAGYPNGSGIVTMSMLPGNYDFEAGLVQRVRGEVGGRDHRRVDRDVAVGRGDGVHAGLDRFGTARPGQRDLGAAGGDVGSWTSRAIRTVPAKWCRSCSCRATTSRRVGSVSTR